MLPLITSQMQDDVLRWLCANLPPERTVDMDLNALVSSTGVDQELAKAILENFEERGLIADHNQARMGYTIRLKVEAHKLLQQGGFAIMDALTEANMQKLLHELELLKKQLKPDQLETFNKITAIMSSVASVVSAFNPGN